MTPFSPERGCVGEMCMPGSAGEDANELHGAMTKRVGEYNRAAQKREAGTATDDGAVVKWHPEIRRSAQRGIIKTNEQRHIREAVYTPFLARVVWFDADWCARRFQLPSIFPAGQPNEVICSGGMGGKDDSTALMGGPDPGPTRARHDTGLSALALCERRAGQQHRSNDPEEPA